MGYKTDWFKGVFPALVTPFTSDDKFDEAAYRQLIQYVLPHVNGIVPCGTTGEFSYMSFAEKQRVIEVALDEVNGKIPVLAGTGCQSTREAVKLTAWAKDAGVNGALVVAPYYLKPTFNELYDHFKKVNEVGLPMVLYNIPQCMGTHLKWWTAEGMALAFDNVVGIKDSSGDMPFFMALLEKLRGKISVFCGHDEIASAALMAGGDGVILASANIIPDRWQEIYRLVQDNEFEMARQKQKEIQIMTRITTRKGANQAMKEALRMVGIDVGHSRLPVIQGGAFEREDYEDVRTQLENLGKITKRKVKFAGAEVDYAATPETPAEIADFVMAVGEGFAGPPAYELAHIDLLIGKKGGPVEKAMERALQETRPGHELVIINEHPHTMLVPTVTVRGEKAKQLVYTDSVEGINLAIDHAIKQGFLPETMLDDMCMIANVFVHPAANNRRRVAMNNYKAMRGAIRKAIEQRPTLRELVAEKEAARHPFRYAP